jgi:glycosyltransferase involved in cell wall biosynthesis
MPQFTEEEHSRIAELNQPAKVGARFGITRYLLEEVYNRQPHLREAYPDLEGEDGRAFVEWVHVHGRYDIPIVDEFLPPAPAEFRYFTPGLRSRSAALRRLGVNVLGHLRAEMGIGEAGRLSVMALDAVNVPVLPVEGSEKPLTRHQHDFQSIPAVTATFPINLVTSNPLGYFALVRELGEEFFADRVSIGFWWWEIEGAFPLEWRSAEEHLAEVWVSSEHSADALRPFCSIPVAAVRLPVVVSPPPPLERSMIGGPEGFVFMFVFDFVSTLARKNPFGVIEAFGRAFPPGSGARLVLKCVNPQVDPDGHRQLLESASAHPDVSVLTGYVSSAEKNGMIAACDCYVSLHRAEAFGLTSAEAMYLGKPVIATGYSGNLDYMTPDNSLLVDYNLTPVGPGAGPYPADGTWAEPDIDHAAHLMRQVFEDPAAAERMGKRAAEDIRRTHSPLAAGRTMEARLAPLAEEAARLRWAARQPALAAAEALTSTGPFPLESRSPIGRLVNRLVLRVLRPYLEHQRMTNKHLVASVRKAADIAVDLELQAAHARAEALAVERRRAGDGPAATQGPGRSGL